MLLRMNEWLEGLDIILLARKQMEEDMFKLPLTKDVPYCNPKEFFRIDRAIHY